MDVYKSRWFNRWARKQGLADALMAMTPAALDNALKAGELMKVNCDA
jgi:hypothetical protein